MCDTITSKQIPELEAEASDLSQQLTPNQLLFCTEYLKDRNGARAYKATYKNCKNDAAARANASRLLTNDNIAAYIQICLEMLKKKNLIATDSLLKEESLICFSDIRNVFPDDDFIQSLPADVTKLISNYKIRETPVRVFNPNNKKWEMKTEVTREVKLHDKGTALARMERHLGMYKDKVEHSAPGSQVKYEDVKNSTALARRLLFIFDSAIRENKEKENQ